MTKIRGRSIDRRTNQKQSLSGSRLFLHTIFPSTTVPHIFLSSSYGDSSLCITRSAAMELLALRARGPGSSGGPVASAGAVLAPPTEAGPRPAVAGLTWHGIPLPLRRHEGVPPPRRRRLLSRTHAPGVAARRRSSSAPLRPQHHQAAWYYYLCFSICWPSPSPRS